MSVAEWADTYGIHNWRILFEVAIEIWPELDLYPGSLNSIQTL